MSAVDVNRAIRADNLTARRAEELQVVVVMNQTLSSALFRWRLVESFLWLLVETLELVIRRMMLMDVLTDIAQIKIASNATRRCL